MTREEFHRAYRLMPEDFKAELIGGIVYVSSPLRRFHATRHLPLGTALFLYAGRTAGLEAGDNGTVILGEEDEPQPDLTLRILPEFGGQSRTTGDDYIEGAPELAAEIAHSTRALDFHAKKDAYAAAGVLEYIVLSLGDRSMTWFDLKRGRELRPGPDGVIRSEVFPGLWLDPAALFAMDAGRVVAVIEAGLASPEYAAFAARLTAAGPRSS
jgi:Uma2 family endonuclease